MNAALTQDEELGRALLPAQRVAEILGCSYPRLCAQLRAGVIPPRRLGRRWLLRWPDVWAALEVDHGQDHPHEDGEPRAGRPGSAVLADPGAQWVFGVVFDIVLRPLPCQ